VDVFLLEKTCPSSNGLWKEWKHNLPDYCEKEKVFLDIVQLEYENPYSFMEMMNKLSHKLEKEFVEFIETETERIEEIHQKEIHLMVIPTMQNWKEIKKNLVRFCGICENVSHFFLRTSLQHYKNDWTATITSFRNLLMGKIIMGIEPYKKHTCFIKGTPVWTTDGIKPIEQIQAGDKVFTHNGRSCRVINTFKNKRENRKLYTIHTSYGKVATATEDHEFLVYSTDYHLVIWKRVYNLTRNDYLVACSLVDRQSFHFSNHLKNYPNLDVFIHKYPRIVGISISRIMGNNGFVAISTNELDDCLKQIEENDLKIYDDLVINLTNISIRMKVWKWVLETNQHEFVWGWWEAFQNKTYFDTKEEAELVNMILNLYNYNVELKRNILIPGSKWCLEKRKRMKLCCCQNEKLFIEDKMFVRFSHKKKVLGEHPFVYTLGVDKDHSYTVNGYIVKNCMGLTPNTMVLKENIIVPISELQPGDFILDKTYSKVKISNIIKNHYEGQVFSIHDCSHSASTIIYLKNNGNARHIQDLEDNEKIQSPSIWYYYDKIIDKKFSNNLLNFLLKYVCDWKIEEENEWFKWPISISDKLFLSAVLPSFHSFHYKLHDNDIYIKKDILTEFINQCVFDLLYISVEKLKYFFSYIDRVNNGQIRLDHKQSHFCDTLRFFINRENNNIQQHNYIGDIYDIEVEGDGFCTSQTIIKKDFKVSIENRNLDNFSYLYIPDVFFQKINIEDGENQTSKVWQEIVRDQLKNGKPSIVCVDRNKNECVSGDTRILTYNGIVSISSKKDEIVSVWNGTHFTDVMITQTGYEKKFLKFHFSNGMCLTCTPYHKFFLLGPDGNIKKSHASEIVCGDEMAPYQLPSISTIDVLPSSIIMTLEWIAKRCVYIENYVVLFDKDVESLKDILMDLQYCGLASNILFNSYRNEYELRIKKERWNLLNYRHLNKHTIYIEGDIIKNIKVVRIEESQKYQESYCFHEPFSGTAIFEGIATGQCENFSDVMCVQGFIDVSKFITTNPLKKHLYNYHVSVYTTKDCPFLRLLQLEYEYLEFKDIETCQEEWNIKRHAHALSSVPAIFLDNIYVGNFIDFWKHYLCPVLEVETLYKSVYLLCQGLDNAIDQEQKHKIINGFGFLSNRPILLKVANMRNVLVGMKLSLDDPQSQKLNDTIFKTIYHAAIKASNDLSVKKGPCINSSKIISKLEDCLENNENLWQNILKKGIRNAIYIRTLDEIEKNILYQFYQFLRKEINVLTNNTDHLTVLDTIGKLNSVRDTNIPNSLKKIYQNEYEVSQLKRLRFMVERKKYNVVDDIFHLYIDDQMDEELLSELQQKVWGEGFDTIQIHHK
jgi:hypothetical protein